MMILPALRLTPIVLSAALALLLLAGPAGARRRHVTAHKPPSSSSLVRCDASQQCIDHFKATISGVQDTSWNVPAQTVSSYADCSETISTEGRGTQHMVFSGSGIVEARGHLPLDAGGNDVSFRFLPTAGARVGSWGIGLGRATITRMGSLITHHGPGSCGGSGGPDTQEISGCGTRTAPWSFSLEYLSANYAQLYGVEMAGLGPASGPDLYNCRIVNSGFPYPDPNMLALYTVPGRLALSRLLRSSVPELQISVDRTYDSATRAADSVASSTGSTRVRWTIDLRRIRHRDFPVR